MEDELNSKKCKPQRITKKIKKNKEIPRKSRIWETLNLFTCADSVKCHLFALIFKLYVQFLGPDLKSP